MVSGFAPIGAQWSVHENIINQMESGKQFNIRGKLTIRAIPGQIRGSTITVTISGKVNGEEIRPLRAQMRHTQRGVIPLRTGKSIQCGSIWLRGKQLLKYQE
jgi:ribosomal protein S3